MNKYHYNKERMVRWFDPGQLMGTGIKTALSTIFGSYADQREVQAALDGDERIYFALHGQVEWSGDSLGDLAREGGEKLLDLCRQIGEVLDLDLTQSPGLHSVSDKERGDAPPGADWYVQTESSRIYLTKIKGDQEQTPHLIAEGYSDDPLFFDYIADLGDGWKSTYTMASLVASDLQLDEQSRRLRLSDYKKDAEAAGAKTLPRGRFLVFGGDEVYPTASRDEYRNRLVGPYHDASLEARKAREKEGENADAKEEAKASRIFAIPGNHDWYDGLTAFTRLFCQKRWIGGWRTQQARSYFAVRLSNDWWLWGVDTQLKADIDAPQLNYFRKVARDHMRPGDRVVLCTPEPTWVYTLTHGEKDAFNNLYFLQKKIIEENGCILAVTIAGDLHHYCRYKRAGAEGGGGDIYKITAGGGGAFLHGTGKSTTPQELPLRPDLNDGNKLPSDLSFSIPKMSNTGAPALFPSTGQSFVQTFKGFAFPFTNWTFSLCAGLLYLIFGWLLQSASKVDSYTTRTLMDDLATRSFSLAALQCTLSDVLYLTEYSPPLVLFALFLYGALTAFADVMRFNPNLFLNDKEEPFNWRYRWAQAKRFVLRFCVLGGMHTAAHLLVALGILWCGAWWNIGQYGFTTGQWRNLLLTSGELFIVGGFAGCIVMGVYLLSSYYIVGVHNNELFSALRVQSYKNFLRLHLSKEGLKIYPIGTENVHIPRYKLQKLRGRELVEKVGAQLIEDVPIVNPSATEG